MKKSNTKKQWQTPKLILFEADQVLSGTSPSFGAERIQYCNGAVLMTHTEAGNSQTFMGMPADALGDTAIAQTPNAAANMCS